MIFLGVVLCLLVAWIGNLFIISQTRSYELERQDMTPEQGRFTMAEYSSMVEMLAHMNTQDPFGYNATLHMFNLLDKPPSSILEVGFGRGDFSLLLARKYPEASVVGIDAHELSVKFANDNYNRLPNDQRPSNVRFEYRSAAALEISENSVDVITTTLVNHHIFPDEEFVEFLRRVKINAKKAFIFNDVYRSFTCYAKSYVMGEAVRLVGIKNMLRPLKLLHGLFPTSKQFSHALAFEDVMRSDRPGLELIIDGGILSTARSFSMPELMAALRGAGIAEDRVHCTTSEDVVLAPCRLACIVNLEGYQ
jgi:2-polyprenyl-3-methyl-5-hydroxy-6-metoxy-1,4-benzoquinol methylase